MYIDVVIGKTFIWILVNSTEAMQSQTACAVLLFCAVWWCLEVFGLNPCSKRKRPIGNCIISHSTARVRGVSLAISGRGGCERGAGHGK